MRYAILFFPFLLSGCFGNRGDQVGPSLDTRPPAPAPAPAPIINLPAAEVVDLSGLKADLRSEMQNSSNSTQSQMAGLFNASVSKLSERITGVEANVTAHTTASATAVASLQAKLESTVTLSNQMQAELKIRNEIDADIKTEIKAEAQLIKELSLKVGHLEASVQAQGAVAANAQVGWNNKFEQLTQQITSTAGRDVNMLPREAVYLMLGIVSALCGLFSAAIFQAYRTARFREANTSKLLMKALARMDPENTKDLNIDTNS